MASKQFFVPGNHATVRGIVAPGATASLYTTGTTTPQPFYSDETRLVSLGTTITADAIGNFPIAYQDETAPFRLILKDRLGAELADIDPFYFGVTTLSLPAAASSYATRADMAAVTAASGAMAYLREAGREGTFVWSSSNLSTQVTADPNQGIYVPPTSATTGASGAWVRKYDPAPSVRWFGAVGNGTTDDQPAIRQAIVTLGSLGLSKLHVPALTYKLGAQVQVDVSNFVIEAWGAKFTAAFTTGQGIIYFPPGHDNIRIIGLHFRLTGGSANPWHFNCYSTNCRLINCTLEKDDNTAGYQGYIQYGADGFVMEGGRLIGSNGWFVEATNVLFYGVKFKGKSNGTSDDAIAIKATNGVTERVNILGCDFDGFIAFCSIGSEIGTAAANDSTYSKIARSIIIDGCTGTNCVYGLYIKPGANDAIDYRDGTVRGVIFSNCILTDPLGTRLQNLVYIDAGRGARVYNVTGEHNKVIGRCKTGASNLFGQYIHVRNDGVGTADPVISGIDVQVEILDPYNGVASGGVAPGSPFSAAVQIDKASAGVGTVSDITLDVTANGTLTNGIGISSGLNGAIFVRRFHATNLDNDGSGAFAGINSASDYSIGSDISMSMAGGSSGVQYTGAGVRTPKLPKQLAASSLIGNATGAQADATAITLAADHAFSGTALQLGAFTGDIAKSAGALATTVTAAATATGAILTTSGSGIGYRTGAGGAVTQLTSRTTGVTLDKICGAITLFSAAGSASWQTFTVTNSAVAATDVIRVSQKSGTDLYMIHVTNVAAGSFKISFATTGGTTTEQPVFNFAVVKAVAA